MTSDDTKMVEPMSKEEMIDTLKGLVFGSFDRTTAKEREALDLVIKELEQQPCEDKCITKAEVINTIHKTMYEFFDIADDDSEESINDKDKLLLMINKAISNAVKALPSVTPSRPKGKWIHWTDDYKDYVTCSCCEYGEEGEVLLSDKTSFCPICGADMR